MPTNREPSAWRVGIEAAAIGLNLGIYQCEGWIEVAVIGQDLGAYQCEGWIEVAAIGQDLSTY